VSQGKLDNVLDSYADSATPKFAQTVLDGAC
jgi:taurine transport system substrate-binding protein